MVISIRTIARAPSLAQSPCHIHTWTLATNRLTNIQATPQSTPVCHWLYFESGTIFLNSKCHTKMQRKREERREEEKEGDMSEEGRKREDDSA